MQIFLDTADIALLKAGVASGLIDGVTTNPSLIAKSGRDFKEVIAEICGFFDGSVSAEVVDADITVTGVDVAFRWLVVARRRLLLLGREPRLVWVLGVA